jgi:hypothetical protein
LQEGAKRLIRELNERRLLAVHLLSHRL